ncbi:SOS response-associated peptidase [Natronobeatus ordinarius]|uniref:SOS response-associated peptidase n=1 Tax=Natronobeatus ordinarius TaxID=2963433 RepID=UPI0020CE8599|nr:SOS response-associated peptidase [Natronobeatus ordinarius]
MCGRYTLFVEQADLEERFDAAFEASFSPRYNLAPGQRLPVITDAAPETVRQLEWGLVPSWADDDANGLINARAETIDEKPSFRDAYRRQDRDPAAPTAGRALVLANGFYEWVEAEGEKRPYRVAFEDDRPFAMAGLWARWEPETTQVGLDAFGGGVDADDEDGVLETFTIVTAAPNDLVADLHHRMAAILEPAVERQWLTEEDPRALLEPVSAAEMRAYPVSTAVNSPANDDPSLVEPLESSTT